MLDSVSSHHAVKQCTCPTAATFAAFSVSGRGKCLPVGRECFPGGEKGAAAFEFDDPATGISGVVKGRSY